MRNFNSKQWIGIVGACAVIAAIVYWDQTQNSTGRSLPVAPEGQSPSHEQAQNGPTDKRAAIATVENGTSNAQAPASGQGQAVDAKPAGSSTASKSPNVDAAHTVAAVQPAEKQAAAAPLPGCMTYRFVSEEKNLSQYPRHVLKLPLKDFDRKSVCVKVNGTPVRYLSSKKSPNEITIGAIMLANPVVEIRACRNGNKCAEDCTIPKDEFMEALAGEEDLSVAQAVSQGWNNSENDQKIDRAIAHFKKDLKGSDEEKGLFYQDWSVEQEKAGCQAKIAKNQ